MSHIPRLLHMNYEWIQLSQYNNPGKIVPYAFGGMHLLEYTFKSVKQFLISLPCLC